MSKKDEMDEILKEVNKKYNLKYINENFSEPTIGSIESIEGIIDEFYISIKKDGFRDYVIILNVDIRKMKDKDMMFLNNEKIDMALKQEKIEKLFKRLKKHVEKFKSANFTENYIELEIGESAKDIQQAIDISLKFLKKEGIKSKCALCGKDDSPIEYTIIIKAIGKDGYHLCDSCTKRKEIELRRKKETVKEKKLLGFLGSLLGGLVGGVFWLLTLIFNLNLLLKAFTLILIPLGVIYGFLKLGKIVNKNGITLICISTIMSVWFYRLLFILIAGKLNITKARYIILDNNTIIISIICFILSIIGGYLAAVGSSTDYIIKRFGRDNNTLFVSSNSKESENSKEILDIKIPASLIDNFEMTEKDKERMARNIEKIKLEGLPFHPAMPVSISESKAVIPNKEAIIKRAAAMQMTGIVSELYNEFGENAQENINQVLEMFNQKYGIKEILTDEEKKYLEKYTDEEIVQTNFNWRYECPPVLLWTLSLKELTDLNTICDFRKTIEYFMENDLETLMNKAKLRSKDEIMDMLDYLYRLNWSAVELRICPENHNNKKFPYDESIIHFRRLALEWLVQPEKSIEDVEAEMHT